MAGYSDTPLVEKLGVKAGVRFMVAGETPPGFLAAVVPLPEGVRPMKWPDDHGRGPADVLVYFTRRLPGLTGDLISLAAAITPAGGLWIAWPKRNSKIPTDVTEDAIREIALPIGLVDNKVCAIDQIWTGLRLVWRKGNRPK